MARGNKSDELVTAPEQTTDQTNGTQASSNGDQVAPPPVPVEVVLLKNIRHSTGVRRKGEKIAVTEEESKELIKAKLARLPE